MKLLYCKKCHDVVALYEMPRKCRCGKSSAHYTDDTNAVYNGPCVPLGFDNMSFVKQVKQWPFTGSVGRDFEAFVIPANARSITVGK